MVMKKYKSLQTYHFSTALITDTGHRIKLGGITKGRFNPSNGSGGKCSGRADEGSDDSGLHGGQGVDKACCLGQSKRRSTCVKLNSIFDLKETFPKIANICKCVSDCTFCLCLNKPTYVCKQPKI